MVEAGDLSVLVCAQRGPIERRFSRPSITPRILEVVRKVRPVHKELLGDAPYVDAGPTHAIHLSDRHSRSEVARHPSRPHATRPRANDEKVVIVISHLGSPRNLGHRYGRAAPLLPARELSKRCNRRKLGATALQQGHCAFLGNADVELTRLIRYERNEPFADFRFRQECIQGAN